MSGKTIFLLNNITLSKGKYMETYNIVICVVSIIFVLVGAFMVAWLNRPCSKKYKEKYYKYVWWLFLLGALGIIYLCLFDPFI